jgi:hypothetical protein
VLNSTPPCNLAKCAVLSRTTFYADKGNTTDEYGQDEQKDSAFSDVTLGDLSSAETRDVAHRDRPNGDVAGYERNWLA